MGWQSALVFAVVGEVTPEQDGSASGPDLDAIVATLTGRAGGPARIREQIAARHGSGEPWPYPVPAELRAGLGAAQLVAVIAEVRRRLELDPPEHPVLSDRPPDADERRLLAEVPPHHGH